jgi:hypothetical protein
MPRAVHRFRMAICRLIGIVTTIVGYGLTLTAVGVLLLQCMAWLHDGYWTGLQFRLAWKFLGLTEGPLPWRSVEKIRTWILDLPLVIAVFPGGVAAFIVGVIFIEVAEPENDELDHGTIHPGL